MSSLKIERDTFQQGAARAASAAADQGPSPAPVASILSPKPVGTALTGGKGNAGTKGYLAVGAPHPLLTVLGTTTRAETRQWPEV